jgi:CRISPR-associated protein Csy3
MSATDKDGKNVPIVVENVGIRGQTSQSSFTGDANNAGLSNPQMINRAIMPIDCEQLKIECSVRFINNSHKPNQINNYKTGEIYQQIAKAYGDAGGYNYLAERFLSNMANGRAAYRNRSLSSSGSSTIEFDGKSVSFDIYSLPLDSVPTVSEMTSALTRGTEDDLNCLIKYIESGLCSDQPSSINLTMVFDVNPLTEVYPSQLYPGVKPSKKPKGPNETISKEEAKDLNRSDKLLAFVKVPFKGEIVNQATLSPQKVGNALRCYDDWHENSDFAGIPIPVNGYGGIQEIGLALRTTKTGDNSFSHLQGKPAGIIESLNNGEPCNDTHFFMANLIRGGVFGTKDPKDAADKNKKAKDNIDEDNNVIAAE